MSKLSQLNQQIELHQLALQSASVYTEERHLLKKILDSQSRHFIGIVGPRGVGKTILLKQLLLKKESAFYISVDTLDMDLFDVVKSLHQKFKYSLFLLDEIHFHKSFEEALKKIYDFLPVRVIFTSSVSLSLFNSAYDLSRRVVLEKLYPFSYREFLQFRYGYSLPKISFGHILSNEVPASFVNYASHFEEYLQGLLFPFSLEEADPLPILGNVVQTVLHRDIPRLGRVTIDELEKIEKLLAFIGKSDIDGINYTSLSKNIGITKYKAEQYVTYLEQAFIVHKVMPTGTNVLMEPKVLMAPPYRLLYRNYEDCLGGLREDFFVESMRSLNMEIFYLKSLKGQKMPDYLLVHDNQKVIIEIGGPGKGAEQFKGIKTESISKIILSHSMDVDDHKRPLFYVGMLQ